MVKSEVTSDERLTRTFLEGLTDVVPEESSTTAAQGRMRVSFPAKAVLSDIPLKQETGKGDTAARGEHGQHQDHDGGISGGPGFFEHWWTWRERDFVEWMRGELHMDMKNPYSPGNRALSRAADELPEREHQIPKLLENFPPERSRLLTLLSVELGWQSWSKREGDWTKSAK